MKYWTDESLEAAYNKWPGHKAGSNPTLDIYQYHLYTDFDPRFNPCLPDPNKTLDAAKVHKPILIGEVQVRMICFLDCMIPHTLGTGAAMLGIPLAPAAASTLNSLPTEAEQNKSYLYSHAVKDGGTRLCCALCPVSLMYTISISCILR